MKVLTFIWCSLLAATSWAVANQETAKHLQAFLQKHCVQCHGEKKSKGNLTFHDFSKKIEKEQNELYLKILQVLEDQEMPPEEEPQPTEKEVAKAKNWIQARLTELEQQTPRMTVRRMNRTEYNNTIRDLFGIDLKPARVFPEDDSAHGFDNVGSALTISPLLLEKYLNAAEFITARTIFTEKPETQKFRWKGEELGGVREKHLKEVGRWPENGAGIYFQQGPRPNNNRNNSSYKIGKRMGNIYPVPKVPGKYIIRFKAHAVGTGITPDYRYKIYYNPPHLENFPEGHLDAIMKFSIDGGAFERVYIDRDPKVYEVSTWAEPGEVFTYNFENAPPNVAVQRVGKLYKGPGLIIDWLEWEGPVFDEWPPKSHQQIFFKGETAEKNQEYAKEILTRIATKAFRRPGLESEMKDLLALYDLRQKEGDSFERSVASAIELILCSPSFLYLTEPSDKPETPRPLNGYELASRLSYFVWSTLPDEELITLAESGKLQGNNVVLKQQVQRMLKDPKSNELVEQFVGQWLNLRKIKDVAVEQRLYPHYSDYLKHLLVKETEAFFREILDHDLSVLNFIDSNFMMINDRLGYHYGIEDIRGPEFRRISVPNDGKRGGLISQGSILTLTTCGTRTSPVMRGVWVMEKLLGTEPPPPPKEVPAITPDTRGAVTIRDQLAKHREDPSCAPCHEKFDAFGLALENYNVVGKWRDHYWQGYHRRSMRKVADVDAKAQFKSHIINSPKDLRQTLLKHKDQFCESLVENLLVYALGRGLEFGDRPTLKDLEHKLEVSDYNLEDLIVNIVLSKTFQMK